MLRVDCCIRFGVCSTWNNYISTEDNNWMGRSHGRVNSLCVYAPFLSGRMHNSDTEAYRRNFCYMAREQNCNENVATVEKYLFNFSYTRWIRCNMCLTLHNGTELGRRWALVSSQALVIIVRCGNCENYNSCSLACASQESVHKRDIKYFHLHTC